MADEGIKLELDQPETISMREGEELEAKVLAEYLRDKLAGADAPLFVKQFAGGHANLTYLLRFGEREYVLRRPPLGPVAPSAHDMGREYRVLAALYQAFPPAPRAFHFCENATVIGAPFFIMERKQGTVVRGTVPPEYGGGQDPKRNRVLSEVLTDTLADLHHVDAEAIGLGGIGKPDGFMQRQISGWTERYRRAATKEIEVVESLSRWLLDNIPALQRSALLHNDWRLDNMMLDAQNPAKVVGVFDWDMCTLGDPLADMGCLLSLWLEEGEGFGGAGVMPTQVPGFMKRREAVERYGEKSGLDISNIIFYYVFGLFKMAVIVQQIYYRYHVGQTKDRRFKSFGMLAEFLINMAHNKTEHPGL